jgi:hypothetical protein
LRLRRGPEVGAVSGDKIGGTSPFTLGIEEEFHLVDLRTRQLTPRADGPGSRVRCTKE